MGLIDGRRDQSDDIEQWIALNVARPEPTLTPTPGSARKRTTLAERLAEAAAYRTQHGIPHPG